MTAYAMYQRMDGKEGDGFNLGGRRESHSSAVSVTPHALTRQNGQSVSERVQGPVPFDHSSFCGQAVRSEFRTTSLPAPVENHPDSGSLPFRNHSTPRSGRVCADAHLKAIPRPRSLRATDSRTIFHPRRSSSTTFSSSSPTTHATVPGSFTRIRMVDLRFNAVGRELLRESPSSTEG